MNAKFQLATSYIPARSSAACHSVIVLIDEGRQRLEVFGDTKIKALRNLSHLANHLQAAADDMIRKELYQNAPDVRTDKA